MCVEKVFRKGRLRVIRTDDLNQKTIRQLVFGICSLRERQLPKFERIRLVLKRRQMKDNRNGRRRIRRKYEGKKLKEKLLNFEEGQRKEREQEFKEIRRRLEKKSKYFKSLNNRIKRRQKKLRDISECTFSVVCKYLIEYKKANKK